GRDPRRDRGGTAGRRSREGSRPVPWCRNRRSRGVSSGVLPGQDPAAGERQVDATAGGKGGGAAGLDPARLAEAVELEGHEVVAALEAVVGDAGGEARMVGLAWGKGEVARAQAEPAGAGRSRAGDLDRPVVEADGRAAVTAAQH